MNPIKLLVVDDNLANRQLPGLILRKQGHTVTECESGEEALVWLQQQVFTHLLLDISLPKVSGLEVCRRVRSLPEGRGLQIIAYTAHALPDETKEMWDAGFDRVLVKPIRRQDLLDVLV
jgi:CheY-like chemotaxis protein